MGSAVQGSTATPGAGRATARERIGRAVRTYPAVLIVGLGVLLRLPLVALPLTYREDIWRQSDTASIAHNFLTNSNILFPAINWGGAGPGYVESEFPLYPWVVSRLYVVFGEHVWLGRLVSLLCSAVAIWLFWRLAERILPRRASWIALIFFVFCPLYLRYSIAFMPEATTMAASVGALLYFDRWLADRTWRSAMACAVLTMLAALVKPTALYVCLTFAVLLILRREWRRILSAQVLVFAAVVLIPVAAWLWHGVQLHEQYGNTFGVISGGDSKFGSLTYWTSPQFYVGVVRIDLLWIFSVVGVPFAVFGVVAAVRRQVALLIPAGAIATAVYYFAVARYAEGNLGLQYHVFATIYAALAVGLGLDVALDWMRKQEVPWRRSLTAGVAVGVLGFAGGAAFAYVDQFRPRAEETLACGAVMRQVIPTADLIVVTSDSAALDGGTANNYQDPTLFFFGDRRGWSVPIDQDQGALAAKYRGQGARWIVVTQASYAADDALRLFVTPLAQVGPGTSENCGIYPMS